MHSLARAHPYVTYVHLYFETPFPPPPGDSHCRIQRGFADSLPLPQGGSIN